jgi:hypothetical protein
MNRKRSAGKPLVHSHLCSSYVMLPTFITGEYLVACVGDYGGKTMGRSQKLNDLDV